MQRKNVEKLIISRETLGIDNVMPITINIKKSPNKPAKNQK